MDQAFTSIEAAPIPRRTPRPLLAAGLAIASGALVVVLSPLGMPRQVGALAALVLGPPLLLLFLTRPHLALAAYLFLLPLLAAEGLLFGLNAGELLTAAVVVLSSIAMLSRPGAVMQSVRQLQWLLWPIFGLAVLTLVSMVVNGISSLDELASALFKIIAFGFVTVVVHAFADTDGARRAMLRGLLGGAAAVALYSVVSYLLGWSYWEAYGYNRAAGTFSTWNHLGGFMALMCMPTLGYAASRPVAAHRLLLIGAFMLEVAALLLSLTMGALVGLVVGGVAAGAFLFRVEWRRLLVGGLLFLVAFFIVFATSPLLRDKLLRIDERIIDRLITYEVGWRMMGDRIWFGFGSQSRLIDAFQLSTADYGITSLGQSSVIPHNSFILIGVEKGILGVLLLVLLILGSLVVLFRHRRVLLRSADSTLYQGAVVGVLAFLFQNLANNLVLHARLGILFFSLIAIVDRIGRSRAESREASAAS